MATSYRITDPFGNEVDLATETWTEGYVARYIEELIPPWPLPEPAEEGYGVLSMYSESAGRWLVYRDEEWTKNNILAALGTAKNYTDVKQADLQEYIDDRDQYVFDENHRYTDQKFSELDTMNFETFLSYVDKMDES